MKPIIQFNPSLAGLRRGLGSVSGFTMPNLLVSTSIFIMLIGGVIASHLFGLKLSEISLTILGVSSANPAFTSQFYMDMHQVKKVTLGHGNAATFQPLSDDELQIGSAIQIETGNDPSVFIRYFADGSDGLLKRMTHVSGSLETATGYLADTNVFSAQDFSGNILTNRQALAVIALDLDYSKMIGTSTEFGTNNYFDSYQFSLKYTPRTGD